MVQHTRLGAARAESESDEDDESEQESKAKQVNTYQKDWYICLILLLHVYILIIHQTMYTTLKSTYLYLACSCRSMRSLPDSQTASFPDLRNSRNLFLGWKRRLLKLGNPIPVRRASESRSSRPSFFVKTTSAWFHGNGPSSNHHKPIPASLICGAWPISRQLMRSWRSSTRRVRW